MFLNRFLLADEWFGRFTTYLVVNNNLCIKLVSSSVQIIFDDKLIINPVSFFVAAFNLSSYESDNFMFDLLFRVTLYWYLTKTYWFYEICA